MIREVVSNRLEAKKGLAPLTPPTLGNFADISHLNQNFKLSLLRDVSTLYAGVLACNSLLHNTYVTEAN